MADIKIRRLDDKTVRRLDNLAAQAGMSREGYIRELLMSATQTAEDVQAIRLVEPLPCGILTASGNCGRPAHVASLWPGPVPGQWVLLPVCETDVKRLKEVYKLL